MKDDWSPVIFGAATGCVLIGVFLIGSEIHNALKRHKKGSEKQWDHLTQTDLQNSR